VKEVPFSDGSAFLQKLICAFGHLTRPGNQIRTPPKPLIPLMPATVHGVVFDILFWKYESAG
jgi:hypothetical protein